MHAAHAAPTQHSQMVVSYLNSVLSQRGQGSLPYAEDAKWTIRQHLLDLLQQFPSLQVKNGSYTHNDGRRAHLLRAEGTVPMYYQGVRYNIPVTVFLLEAYPRAAPLVYVCPTPDMIVKPRHASVEPSGKVACDCLRQWMPPRSNLVELGRNLSTLFSNDPPLFSKPPGWTPPPDAAQSFSLGASPPPPSNHPPAQTFANPMQGGGNAAGGNASAAAQAQATQHQHQQHRPAAAAAAQAQAAPRTPSEAFRSGAVARLTHRISSALRSQQAEEARVLDGLFEEQNALERRAESLERGCRSMEAEREGLEAGVQKLNDAAARMKQWLQAHPEAVALARSVPDASKAEPPVDEAVVARDARGAQLLAARADDLAIEDALYALEEAFRDGAVKPADYLKHTRALCRDQFFTRATQIKVMSTVASSARPAPPPAAAEGVNPMLRR